MKSLAWTPGSGGVPALVGGLVALSLAALTSLLLYYVGATARLQAEAQARAALGDARAHIERGLDTALAVPETLAAVIAAQERIDRRAFNAIASRLILANPSIRNVALAPDGVITAVYPLRGNEPTLGLRYADLPAQNEGVLRAIRSRRTVVVGPIDLVQGGSGLVSRTPVFLRDADGADTVYWGIVALAIDTNRLFEDIDRIGRRDRLDIALRGVDTSGRHGPVFAGAPEVFERQPLLAEYLLPGGDRWQIGVAADPERKAIMAWHGVGRVLVYALAALLGWTAYRVVASRYRNRELAHRDPLTGLANRTSFDHRLEVLLKAAPDSCAMVLIDLDAFKPLNDSHGHSAGDRMLRQVGERLQHLVRGSDAVYRLGGDEFAILLQDVHGQQDMLRLAERAVQRIGEPMPLEDGRVVRVGASAGVALFPRAGRHERALDVFDRADRALYRSKAEGGNQAQADPHPPAPGTET